MRILLAIAIILFLWGFFKISYMDLFVCILTVVVCEIIYRIMGYIIHTPKSTPVKEDCRCKNRNKNDR